MDIFLITDLSNNYSMDLKNTDMIMHFSPEPGVMVYYMQISLFIEHLFPDKMLSDFRIRKSCRFEHNDFKIRFLSQEELELLNGYKSLKKQVEWIAGRFLVKNMVRDFIDENADLPSVNVRYKKEGMPFLHHYPSLSISITHSGNYVAVALCAILKKIGLDLEKDDYLPDKSFMNVAFTQREISSINFESQEVMRIWTLKEAFLKYIGKGFNESLHTVEVLKDKILYNGNQADVKGLSFNIGIGYILSIVYG